jgi:hypothetical protein
LAGQQHRLGPVSRPLLGYPDPRVAMLHRPRHLRWFDGRTERPSRGPADGAFR